MCADSELSEASEVGEANRSDVGDEVPTESVPE